MFDWVLNTPLVVGVKSLVLRSIVFNFTSVLDQVRQVDYNFDQVEKVTSKSNITSSVNDKAKQRPFQNVRDNR